VAAPIAREPVVTHEPSWQDGGYWPGKPSQVPAPWRHRNRRAGSPRWPRSNHCTPTKPAKHTGPAACRQPIRAPSVKVWWALLSGRNTNRPERAGSASRSDRGEAERQRPTGGKSSPVPGCHQQKKSAAARALSSSLAAGASGRWLCGGSRLRQFVEAADGLKARVIAAPLQAVDRSGDQLRDNPHRYDQAGPHRGMPGPWLCDGPGPFLGGSPGRA